MKPFNLEAAKRGEPITTRDVRSARFLAHVPEAGEDARIVAMVEGEARPRLFRESGICNLNIEGSAIDLVMAARVVWVNFYDDHSAIWFKDEESAIEAGNRDVRGLEHSAVRVEI